MLGNERAEWPQPGPPVRGFAALRAAPARRATGRGVGASLERALDCRAMELDRLDRLLLNLVQEDAAQTTEQMAQQVPLSPSAIQRRLRRLREQGVITRQVAVVEPRKVGRPTTFVVSLQVERDRPELLGGLRAWLAAQPHVQQAFYVTGEADFMVVVTAPDTETYDALMARLLHDNPNVRRFTTHVALAIVKRGLTVPVPLDDGAD